MTYQHGLTMTEVTEGTRPLVTVATAVIGLVATATAGVGGPTAALNAAFPLNKPVLVTDIEAAIGEAGTGGTLKGVLRAIADQTRTPVVVVRVAPGANGDETAANVIGDTVAGQKTGMQALLAAQAQAGVRPRIIGAPGLETTAVVAALAVVANKLRGMAYARAVGASVADMTDFREGFGARELMLLGPDFLAFDVATAANVTSHAAARAMGLRARIDKEQGWHKTLSNVPVDGVIGLTSDIGFDVQDPTCEANLLNAEEITTLIRTDAGFRFWGSRTTSAEPLFAFESAVRTAQVLMDTIAGGMMWAIDKPLRPSLAKDIVETINAKIREMKREGQIIDGRAWFDATKNPATSLAAGKLTIDYDYTPVPPLENLMLNQRITDSYFADFAAGMTA